MNKIIIILITSITIGLFSCETKTNDTNNTPIHNTNSTLRPPDITWKLGVGIKLYKPSKKCLFGLAICKINAIFIEFDWEYHEAPINFGVSNDSTFIIEFIEGNNIPQFANQNYMDIENGDEFINIENGIIDYFIEEGSVDLTGAELVTGRYYFEYDEETENYYIEIPYTY